MTRRSLWTIHSSLRALTLTLLIPAVLAIPAQAQEALPEGISTPNADPSSLEPLMDRTDLGNVAQTARLRYSTGVRELKKAKKLQEKADQSSDPEEKARTADKARQALESADKAFREALSYNAGLIEAYAGLGTTLRLLGKNEDALQIHAMALRREPEDLENFAGWTESLLALNMLGNATATYTDYVQSNPARAEILMTAIENWLADRATDPGEIDPADVQRLADWVAQQKPG